MRNTLTYSVIIINWEWFLAPEFLFGHVSQKAYHSPLKEFGQ